MASSFYSKLCNYPRNSGRYYYHHPAPPPCPSPSPPARKVVSVPVHYVDSSSSPAQAAKIRTRQSRSDAAANTIQKAFRGFLVRKSLRKIARIRNEVNAVEIRISDTSDLICRDPKERLKVAETLMSLILKLDSVPGSDPGVRGFRKRVTKKAIALQEFVDSIADSAVAENQETLESAATTIEEAEGHIHIGDGDSASNSPDQAEIAGELNSDDQAEESQSDSTGSLEDWTVVEEDEEEEKQQRDRWTEREEEEKRKSREVMEKMAKENERMMEIMAALYERNQKQTRLLNALSQRVEQLETALICDKLRRSKRQNGLQSAAYCTPENAKAWKKL